MVIKVPKLADTSCKERGKTGLQYRFERKRIEIMQTETLSEKGNGKA
jgi:hypothetical protein